jgi:hypothetical protein
VAHGIVLGRTPCPRFPPSWYPSGGHLHNSPVRKPSFGPQGSLWRRSNLLKMLAGDLIMRALGRLDSSTTFDLDSAPVAFAEPEQGGTDARNIAEFLAFEIPFEVEPATGLILPVRVDRG